MRQRPAAVSRSVLSLVLAFSLAAPAYAGTPSANGTAKSVSAGTKSRLTRSNLAKAEETGKVVVAYERGKRAQAVAGAKSRGASVVRSSAAGGYVVVKTPTGQSDRAFARQLERQSGVRYAEPVLTRRAEATASDPLYSEQWALTDAQGVHAETAWDTTRGSAAVKVAVVDTGVDLTHPDLVNRIDSVDATDVIEPGTDPADEHGHGTHVAGIIAAESDNATGVAGIANLCNIIPVRVLDAQGQGQSDQIAAGIRWAADHGAKVINMSFGGLEYSEVEAEAIADAVAQGAVLVAASGNEAAYGVFFPARYSGVISVGSIGTTHARSWFSDTGSQLDLVAPGEDVLSTFPTYDVTDTANKSYAEPGYELMSGTSMASPIVAGSAALVASQHSTWTAEQIEATLKATADDLGRPGRDDAYGWGMVRPDLALAQSEPAQMPSFGDDNVPGVALPPSPATGDLDDLYDNNDVFAVSLKAGDVFEATATPTATGSGAFEIALYAFGPGTTDVDTDPSLAFSEEMTGPQTMKFTAPADAVYYIDIFDLVGAGTYSMDWSVTPLKTTIAVDPAAPVSGWYQQPPTITLTSNFGVDTYYHWNDESDVPYTGPITEAPEGTNTLTYHSVDEFGNVEAEKSADFSVDTVKPDAPVLNLDTHAGTSATISWDPVVDASSGLDTYQVWVDGALRTTTSDTTYTEENLSTGQSHSFVVKAVDVAGWVSDPSNTVPVIVPGIGTTAPGRVQFGRSANVTVTVAADSLSANTSVTVETRTSASTWSTIGTKKTDANGRAVFSITPQRKTWYRASAEIGDETTTTAESSMTVDPALALTSVPTDVVRTASTSSKKYFTIKGTLRPYHTKSPSDAVYIDFYRNGGKTPYKTVRATNADAGSGATKYTVFSATTYLTSAGTYAVKARIASHSDIHNAATTGAKTLYCNRPSMSIYSDRTTVYYGKAATLSGYLRSRAGTPLASRYVYLEGSSDGKTWSNSKTLKTSSTGRVAATVKPTTKRYYRFRFPGDSTNLTRTSATKTIKPGMYTGTAMLPSGWKEGITPDNWYLPAGWHQVTVSSTQGLTYFGIVQYLSSGDKWIVVWDPDLGKGVTATHTFYVAKSGYYYIQVGNSSAGIKSGNQIWWKMW